MNGAVRIWKTQKKDAVSPHSAGAKRIASAIVLTAALILNSTAKAATENERPSWCRPNFECLPTSDVANATRQIIDLKEELIKAKGKRFGWTIGPSLGIVGVTTNTFDVKWVPAAGLSITWGLRSK